MQKSSAFLAMFSGHALPDIAGGVIFAMGGIVAVLATMTFLAYVAAQLFVGFLKYLKVYHRCYIGWKFYALHKEWIERDPERSAWSIYTLRKNEGAE